MSQLSRRRAILLKMKIPTVSDLLYEVTRGRNLLLAREKRRRDLRIAIGALLLVAILLLRGCFR